MARSLPPSSRPASSVATSGLQCLHQRVPPLALAQPSATIVEPTGRHLDILAGHLVEAGTAPNPVWDARLAALAVERDATIVSFELDPRRFAGVRSVAPPPS